MADNDTISNNDHHDQPENNPPDQDNQDISSAETSETESPPDHESEYQDDATQDEVSQDETLSEPDNTSVSTDDIPETIAPSMSEDSQPVPDEVVSTPPAKDHTARNIILGLIALVVLLCCCIFLFVSALVASGVLDPMMDQLNINF
ncbi:MAG: hypothetical protein AAF629_29700 [Chloroflexota bacterium]